jgi:uncharacterized membrane protein
VVILVGETPRVVNPCGSPAVGLACVFNSNVGDRQTLADSTEASTVPTRVETTDPDGVDYGWVMQVTFVVTILVGAPVVALASTAVTLPTWGARVGFVLRGGAVVWIVVALGAFLYAKRTDAGDGGDDPDGIESDASDDADGVGAESSRDAVDAEGATRDPDA